MVHGDRCAQAEPHAKLRSIKGLVESIRMATQTSGIVRLIEDERRQDRCHAFEAAHEDLVLLQDAIAGLSEALADRFVSDMELDDALDIGKPE